MAKLRSLSTAFWSDPFIEELTPNQKLLFIYLVTNEKTNMLGIYESSIKKISFETGLKREDVSKDLKAFESLGKVKHLNNYIILTNYMKHQNYNTNMKKAAITTYNDLPKELKINGLVVDKSNPSQGFESLLKGYGTVRKIEYEDEDELEDKDKDKIKDVFSFDEFWGQYPKKVAKIKCENKYKTLTNIEKQKIKDTLSYFISYKPFKDYSHPNPEAYLNKKRWDDELPNIKPKQPVINFDDGQERFIVRYMGDPKEYRHTQSEIDQKVANNYPIRVKTKI